MNNRRNSIFIFAAIVSLAVLSCGASQKDIHGKWQAQSKGAGLAGIGQMENLEFTKDTMIDSGMRSYPYTIPTPGKFSLDVGMGTFYTYDYSVSGNVLTISSAIIPNFKSIYARKK